MTAIGVAAFSASSFNPTLVRLRHPLRPAQLERNCNFQSHAGSIEAPSLPTPGNDLPIFQSHAGSIEARKDAIRNQLNRTFQSHAGSIEAERRSVFFRKEARLSIPRWFD